VTKLPLLAAQLKAARILARMEQKDLFQHSGVPVPTLERMEAGDGPVRGNHENVAAVVAVLEAAGVEFTNGDQPGVRLKLVGAYAQKNQDGEWGVVACWKAGDPTEWAPTEVARVAAAQVEQQGDARLADTLRSAADEAERHSRSTVDDAD
jgi:transcriptional regulator with XRE-family HTH domain